jgi:hypothetical protein
MELVLAVFFRAPFFHSVTAHSTVRAMRLWLTPLR